MVQPAIPLSKVHVQHEKEYVDESPETSVDNTTDVDGEDSPATSKASSVEDPNVKLIVEIYCGHYIQAVPGYQFYCLDW